MISALVLHSLLNRLLLTINKSFRRPFHAIPATYKDSPPYILVQQESNPHTANSPFQRNAEYISQAYGDAPLNYQADIERIGDISGSTQGVCCKDIDGTSDFENDINDENGSPQPDNLLIGSQPMENGVSEDGEDGGKYDGDHHRLFHHIFPHQESGMRLFLPDKMTDTNGTPLCHGDAE